MKKLALLPLPHEEKNEMLVYTPEAGTEYTYPQPCVTLTPKYPTYRVVENAQ